MKQNNRKETKTKNVAILNRTDFNIAQNEGIEYVAIKLMRAKVEVPKIIAYQIINASAVMDRYAAKAVTDKLIEAQMWGFNKGAVMMVWLQLEAMGYVIPQEPTVGGDDSNGTLDSSTGTERDGDNPEENRADWGDIEDQDLQNWLDYDPN